MTRKLVLWLPFAFGVGLLAMFYLGLSNPSDRIIASNMVGQQLPEFVSGSVVAGQQGTTTADFRDGKPRLLNIFASWCVPCVREIPTLMQMKAQGVEIAGLAIHDSPGQLNAFLAQNGNPYTTVGLDQGGRAQLEFGSSGVPETFVIDGSGKIIHQHIGIVTPEDIPVLLAMLEGGKP